MKRIKIVFDAQLLFERQKTGIGWNAKKMIDELVQYPELDCTLNCFLMKDRERTEAILKVYRKQGCKVHQSRWMPARIYYHLERLLPVSYRWIFGKNDGITQFFNYTIPFGVSGKCVTIIHDIAFLTYPETVAKRTRQWLGKNLKIYCQRADVILTVSEFSRQEIHHYLEIPLEKIHVVYNGVDPEQYHPDYSEGRIQEAKAKYNIPGSYILYLGTLEPRKNIETLIRAYQRLLTAGLSRFGQNLSAFPKLVLAGKKGWLYDSIFQLVKEFHLENQVIFTGCVDESDAAPLLCGARMFVFPSLYEGFGIPPLEAMACGTPVIVSDCASLPEVVGDAGLLVPPTDIEKLAENMNRLLKDDHLHAALREAGLKRAGRFTWKASAKKLVQIYRMMESNSKE